MNENENLQFTAQLLDAVREAKNLGYPANEFKKMLSADGGFDAVKRIVAKKHASDGFVRLHSLKRLDLSCEAIIVETKWRDFFDQDLLELAEIRLKSMGYKFTRFVTLTPSISEVTIESAPSFSALAPAEDFVPTTDDGRERELRSVVARPGQGKFRESLMLHYGPTCAISGCVVLAALQAAHIVAFRGVSSDHVKNGLVLRADLHSLFDSYLFSVRPYDFRVVLSPTMKRDPTYHDLDGAIALENSPERPSPNALQVHWNTFLSSQ